MGSWIEGDSCHCEVLENSQANTPSPCISIAETYRVPVSTFKARIIGRLSNIDATAARQKIHLHEEEDLVAYLKETSCCGFPDTRKHCVRCANKIYMQVLAIRAIAWAICGLIVSSVVTMTKLHRVWRVPILQRFWWIYVNTHRY